MARQLADDPARGVAATATWMGDPDSGWRNPVDWRYSTWKIIALLTVPMILVAWLVIPLGAYLAVLVAMGSLWGARRLPGVPGGRKTLAGMLLAVALLAAPWRLWLLPMPWWLALLAGPLAAVMVAKRLEHHVDYNRPLRYWRATLAAILSAPRAHRAPAVFDLPALAVADETGDLTPYHLAALTLDPDKEHPMPRFISRETVQAVQWRPESDAAGGAAILELAKAGIAVRVSNDGGHGQLDVLDLGEGIICRATQYVVLHHRPDGVEPEVVDAQHFERDYMPEPQPVEAKVWRGAPGIGGGEVADESAGDPTDVAPRRRGVFGQRDA